MRLITFVLLLLIFPASLSARLPDLIPYRKGDLWGYCDSTKKMILEPKWEDCTLFNNGRASVQQNEKWGVINPAGEYILDPKWEKCWLYLNGTALVRLNEKWGMIDSLGNYALLPKYYDLYPLSPTRFVAYKDKNHAGVIDDHDSIIVPFKARWITHDADSVLGCAWPGELFICDLNGKPVLKEHEYVDIDCGLGASAKFGLFVVIRKSDRKKYRDDCTGFIVVDTADQQVIPGRYDWIELIGDTMFECEGPDSTSYFDLKGNPVHVSFVEQRVQEKLAAGRPYSEWDDGRELSPAYKHAHDEYYRYYDVFLGYKDLHGTQYWED